MLLSSGSCSARIRSSAFCVIVEWEKEVPLPPPSILPSIPISYACACACSKDSRSARRYGRYLLDQLVAVQGAGTSRGAVAGTGAGTGLIVCCGADLGTLERGKTQKKKFNCSHNAKNNLRPSFSLSLVPCCALSPRTVTLPSTTTPLRQPNSCRIAAAVDRLLLLVSSFPLPLPRFTLNFAFAVASIAITSSVTLSRLCAASPRLPRQEASSNA